MTLTRRVIRRARKALSRNPISASRERAKFARYIAANSLRKLHVGCGDHLLPGWLNADILPGANTIALDATRRFPFPANSFDYVFSEHMIEHIPYESGRDMLTEIFRVLKPGGRVRVATPDLQFLIDLYRRDKTPVQQAYIVWSAATFAGSGLPPTDAVVINNFFREWGHQFIYDEKTLTALMQNVGFGSVIRISVGQSSDPNLRELENVSRMPDGFLELETFVLEGTKPPR
jgi:predicted SAM-dependent methyltransferase